MSQSKSQHIHRLSPEEVIEFLKDDNCIVIHFEKGFEADSDTRDVFEGVYSAEKMEDMPFLDAFDGYEGVSHTFFIKNYIPKGFEAFSDKELVKRLVVDGYWTRIHLKDRPLIEGCYVTILNPKWEDVE